MQKEKPLWERLYFDAAYVAIARLIGYKGTTYRAMLEMLEPLERKFGNQRVHSAAYFLVTFEGQMTSDPKPLATVNLRPEVRRLCWQLLGPPPEKQDAFNRHPDGTRRHPTPATPILPQSTPKEEPLKNKPLVKTTRKKKAGPVKPIQKPVGFNRSAASNSTIMDQYRSAKVRHPDMMLLFRIGDFYELFDEDAETAHKLLGLTLTTRDQATMVGFPHHQLENHLQRMLMAGLRVAICDEAEEPLPKQPIKLEEQRLVVPHIGKE